MSDSNSLERLAILAGRSWRVEELPGGLTNVNYRVTTDDEIEPPLDIVVRCWQEASSWLVIDRDNEHHNSIAAAATGVSPRVAAFEPDQGMMAVDFVEGASTLTETDLHDFDQLKRVGSAVRTLHSATPFGLDFDMFAIQRRYLDSVTENGFRLPDRYVDFMPQLDRIRAALTRHPEPLVPCHNDLLAANFLDQPLEGGGRKTWIIDFEYSGNNEASFELGNIWSEATLSLEHLDALVEAYDGALTSSRVARARLWGLMSKYGWTLWASIMDAVSELDFDFWGWGMEKYDRAVAEFDGPEFDRLLEEVAS